MVLIRLTIMLDDRLSEKLRDRQSKKIKKTQKACSFSQVINETLAKQLRVKLVVKKRKSKFDKD